MNEFDRVFGEEFFIIDSYNIDKIKSKFYGYMIQEKGIIQNEEIDENTKLTGLGAYLWVKVDETSIRIIQDFNGSCGLYLFRNGEYFAISNSYIKLAEYLKNSQKLTFNKDYANSFLFIDLITIGYNNTLINEINVIPRNLEIIINKHEKTLSFEKFDFKEHYIDLDSKEGLALLDHWFNKWVNIIRSLKTKTNNIQIDLTGGWDTRMLATLWLSADINFNKIFIKTIINNTKKSIIEDYEIASQIANRFGFELNKKPFKNKIYKLDEIHTPLLLIFYSKLGFNKSLNIPITVSEEPVFVFSGRGGETIRGYPNKSADQYRLRYLVRFANKGKHVVNSTNNILKKSYEDIMAEFPYLTYDSTDLPSKLYQEIRCRNLYGKAFLDEYNLNYFNISPLLDPELHKLKIKTSDCGDKELLMALMFVRYRPELLEFKVQGNRELSESTVEYAKKINQKYPYLNHNNDFIDGPEIDNSPQGPIKGKLKSGECNTYIQEIFNSHNFEFEFKKHFPAKFYDTIFSQINGDHPTFNDACAALSILNAINYTSDNPKNMVEWLDHFIDTDKIDDDNNVLFNQYLYPYKTARVDIIKESDDINDIEILEVSDPFHELKYPSWFQKGNKCGFYITSMEGMLDIKIRCKGSGRLKVFLRTLDLKDKNKKLFPVYIDFKKLTINDKDYIEGNKLLCYNDHFNVRFNVEDSDIINIHTEWLPFNNFSEYIDKTDNLKKQIATLQTENENKSNLIKKLEDEIKLLKTQQTNH